MQSLKTELGAEIHNANGEIIRRIPFRRCHSLLKQFIQILMAHITQVNQTITDTGGTARSVAKYIYNLGLNAGVETTLGLVIGSGTTPVKMDDYQVETQLTANIAHAWDSFATENPDAATWRAAISRGFTNNTGAAVTVKEVALYCRMGSSYRGCIDRTLYEVTFQAGETLTLTYRISITL